MVYILNYFLRSKIDYGLKICFAFKDFTFFDFYRESEFGKDRGVKLMFYII